MLYGRVHSSVLSICCDSSWSSYGRLLVCVVVYLLALPIFFVLGGRHVCLFVWLFTSLYCRFLLSCVAGTFVCLCGCLLACIADFFLSWVAGTFVCLRGCLLACISDSCCLGWQARLFVCVVVY